MRGLGMSKTTEEITHMIDLVDSDNDGEISFEEFVVAMTGAQTKQAMLHAREERVTPRKAASAIKRAHAVSVSPPRRP